MNDSLRTGLWFDKLTMIGINPFALSLSKGKLSTNGLFLVSIQLWTD
jgi:hypothetical protein